MKWRKTLRFLLGVGEIATELEHLIRAEDTVKHSVRALIFNGSAPVPVISGEGCDAEMWKWEVPNDGRYHVPERWPWIELKIIDDEPGDDIRACSFRFIKEEPFTLHHHNAVEHVTVTRKWMEFRVQGNFYHVEAGESIRLEADVPHYVTAPVRAQAILLYRRPTNRTQKILMLKGN